MKTKIYIFLTIVIYSLSSCSNTVIEEIDDASTINLKWNKSYTEDSFEIQKVALDWCLSYLGATTAEKIENKGITYNNPIISINVDELDFDDNAITQLKKLHNIFKASEEYKAHNAFDLGKYITMTLGSSYHYYKIVGTPEQIDFYTTLYHFNELKGYVNNSSISLPDIHRIITYSKLENQQKQAFIAQEIDSNTEEIKEFEAFQRMSNGQLKFAVYSVDGDLIPSSDKTVSNAGKPANCLWCHETAIQPLFTEQDNFSDYLSYEQLKDTLNFYNTELRNYQDNIWQNPNIQNRQLHTNMELSYISYMEPSAERLASEWNISITEVENLLANLPTHTHHEFPFLGTLYDRRDVIPFSPYAVISPPSYIREIGDYEPNLLDN